MNVNASFARSDHRRLSHDDLFPQEREKTEENKKKKERNTKTDVEERKFIL
jgi:hypothetical protein